MHIAQEEPLNIDWSKVVNLGFIINHVDWTNRKDVYENKFNFTIF